MSGLEGLPGWAQWVAGLVGLNVLVRGAAWLWHRVRVALARAFRSLWLLFSQHRWDHVAHAESIVVAIDQGMAQVSFREEPTLDLWLRLANLGPRDARFTLSRIDFSAFSRQISLPFSAVKELPSQFGTPRAAAAAGAQLIIKIELPAGAAAVIREGVGEYKTGGAVLLDAGVQLFGHLQVGDVGREVTLFIRVPFAVWATFEPRSDGATSARARRSSSPTPVRTEQPIAAQ